MDFSQIPSITSGSGWNMLKEAENSTRASTLIHISSSSTYVHAKWPFHDSIHIYKTESFPYWFANQPHVKTIGAKDSSILSRIVGWPRRAPNGSSHSGIKPSNHAYDSEMHYSLRNPIHPLSSLVIIKTSVRRIDYQISTSASEYQLINIAC